MKNVTPSNPLKTFNDNKVLAVKKMGGAQTSFKKSLSKAQVGQSVKTWNIGDPTPSGQVVKTQKDIENLNKMERLNSYGRPYKPYVKPPVITKPKTIVPKALIGGVFNSALSAKKIYNTYAKAKQKGKVLDRMAHIKKPTKSGITKLMSKSFNVIKNKKK